MQPFFMVVMKPDTFDVENKEVSSQLCLIKNAIERTSCCFYSHNTDNSRSINDSDSKLGFYHLF